MQSPILIVGGGLAGLFTALKLAPLPCLVLAARPLGEGASSSWAQGGVAAAISDEDSAAKHAADTIAAGAGLVDPAVALAMAEEAGDRIRDLLTYGVPFDRDLAGRLVQSREAAHSVHRVVRVKGDMAGAKIMEALVAAVRRTPSITVREGVVAEDLLVQDGRVTGVLARGDMGQAREAFRIRAGETVLATGGLGALYAVTTNPGEARGQGLAMAARAGARIADTEFVQFHPTAIDIGLDPAPLATEALRGDGALLIDRDGHRFMVPIHKDAELAPRDIVARGVFASIQAGKGAFLDCRTAIGAEFPERFPTVHAACLRGGIDPVTQVIPVAPAEHYHMGGVASDMDGRSSLPGLWVAGEVGATGLHGANRLASNSLLEAVVIGARIAEALGRMDPSPLRDGRPVRIRPVQPGQLLPEEARLVTELRRTMTDKVGVVREGKGLKEAATILQGIGAKAKSSALINMTTSALLITTAALNRRESRGGHFRSDFPNADPALAKRTFLTLSPPDTGATA